MPTIFNPNQRHFVSAIFAYTNMGLPISDLENIITKEDFNTKSINKPGSLSYYVELVFGGICESDEMFDGFMEEAESWQKDPMLDSLESIESIWKDIGKFLRKLMEE